MHGKLLTFLRSITWTCNIYCLDICYFHLVVRQRISIRSLWKIWFRQIGSLGIIFIDLLRWRHFDIYLCLVLLLLLSSLLNVWALACFKRCTQHIYFFIHLLRHSFDLENSFWFYCVFKINWSLVDRTFWLKLSHCVFVVFLVVWGYLLHHLVES